MSAADAVQALALAWVAEAPWLSAVAICDRVRRLDDRHALLRAARRLWLG